MRHRTSRVIATLSTFAALAVLSGCGSEPERVADPGPRSAGSSGTPTTTPPVFDAEDYSYRLRSLCFCPLLGPVEIVVQDGSVTSATMTKGADRGKPAPDYMRLTIPELIAKAKDPEADDIDADWPDDQAWPNRISIDYMKRAVDDEITYVISDVRIAY